MCQTYAQKAQSQSEVLKEEISRLQEASWKTFDSVNVEEFISSYYKQLELLDQLEGEAFFKFQIFKEKGDQFTRVDLYRESNKNAKLAIQSFQHINDSLVDEQLSINMFYAYALVARNCLKLNELDSATTYYKAAVAFTKQDKIKYVPVLFDEQVTKASAINNLGVHTLEVLNQPMEALPYFMQADSLMQNVTDPRLLAFLGSIRDNLANVYVDLGDLEKAKNIFEQNYTFYNPQQYALDPDYERWLRAGLQAAEVAIELEQIAVAKQWLKRIDSLLAKYQYKDKFKSRLRYLKAKEHLYYVTHQYQKAYTYKKRQQQLSNNLERNFQVRHKLWSSTLKKLAIVGVKKNLETKYLKKEVAQQKRQFTLWITITLLVLGTITLAFIYKTHKRRLGIIRKDKQIAEQQVELIDLENELLNKKVAIKKRDLSDVAINASQNQIWIKNLLKQFEKLKTTRGRARAKELQELEKEVYHKTLFDAHTKEFYEKIETLSNAFYQKLTEQYPELTKPEIKLCAMIRLGFDNQKIASIQHIHQNSVHQSRYRLKKSLQLTIEEDLDQFLKEF